MSGEEWITVQEAAYEFKVSDTWIYELANTGRIASKKKALGRGTFVDRKELSDKLTPKDTRRDDEAE